MCVDAVYTAISNLAKFNAMALSSEIRVLRTS